MSEDTLQLLSEVFAYGVPMGIQGTYQFVFSDLIDSGEQSTVWIKVGQQEIEVREGSAEATDVEIRIALQDLKESISGKLDIARIFTEGNIQVQGNMPLAEQLPLLIDFWRKGTPKEVVAAYPQIQKRRFPSRRRASEELAAKQPKLMAIERRNELSVAEFQKSYLARGVPVVLSNYTENWRLMRTSPEELKRFLGGAQGMVVQDDYVSDSVSLVRGSAPMAYTDFIDLMNDASLSGDGSPPYMANSPIPDALYPLIEFPPYYPREVYQVPKLWLGPAGTYSGLHRDGTDNLYVQVWGTKRFLMASPDQWRCFYPWATDPHGGLEGCDVDPENPDLERFPLFAQAHLVKVDLGPGDMLYLPEGWFHHVRSLTLTLSINFWPRVARE